jgi:hypothetical protein
MPAVTEQQLEVLKPYIEGAAPDHRGEMEMYCPIHPDTRRSASLNLQMGVWFCHAGCGGGSIRHLIDSQDTWVAVEGREGLSTASKGHQAADLGIDERADHLLKESKKDHERLMEEVGQRRRLFRLRGINRETVRRAKIGFDGRYFKIPIFSPERQLWNIRTYDPSPRFGRRKIWGVRGMNKGRLYPASILDAAEPGDSVLFCEGEWDALLALQAGQLAVTTTSGAGKPWQSVWDVAFAGLRIFVCHDMDFEGQKSNRIVGEALKDIAEVFVCELPYKITADHGKDITDFLINRDDPGEALEGLMHYAKPYIGVEDND